MASLMADSSSCRMLFRVAHSALFFCHSASTSTRKASSAWTCSCSVLISSRASAFLSPRAPCSSTSDTRADWVLVIMVSFASFSFSYEATVAASVWFASCKLPSKVASIFFSKATMPFDLAVYFALNVAFRFSFFQSHSGTSPLMACSSTWTSALLSMPRLSRRAFCKLDLRPSSPAPGLRRRNEPTVPASSAAMAPSSAATACCISSAAAW
mmetsp:Transcript_50011/g.159972  ORF Transcript_50011/g.159972 Transcript_50011/m.159972 type:complete len:212 (+) Transcript_50011:188-823(+)